MPEPATAGLISIVGGESTGKSTLAAEIGLRLPAVVVPEFLRAWVDQRGRVPVAEEQADVMAAHRESEISALRAAERQGEPHADRAGRHWVVSDGGPLMTAVYSIQYYNDASLLATAVEWVARSERVIWCQDDFPWQPDPQRDGAQARATSQQVLAGIFAEHPELPVLAVRGSFDERVQAVLRECRAQRSGR